MKKEDNYMENVYHCDSIELEKLLKTKNIEINDNLLKVLIHKKYCFHIIKSKDGTTKSCGRYRKHGIFCGKHAKKTCLLCNKNIKLSETYCFIHNPEKIIKNNFNFKNNIINFPFLYLNSKYYNTKLNNNFIVVEHKNYSNILSRDNSYLTKFFDIKKHIYNIYLLFKKYNISHIYENRKTDKNVSIFQNKMKEQKITKHILPPLPLQTDDELFLLSHNIIYETNSFDRKMEEENDKLKNKIIKYKKENITLKHDLGEVRKENIKLTQKLKDLEIKDVEDNISNLNINFDKKTNNIKLLKHDIYFLKKEINTLSSEKNKYKNFHDAMMELLNEKGFKNDLELEQFINTHKNNKCSNYELNEIEKYKIMYKKILYEKADINKDIYDLLIIFIHFIKIILNLVDSKFLSINIILDYIEGTYFKRMLEYMKNSKKINFDDSIKIIEFLCNLYNRDFYNKFFDSDGIKFGDSYSLY